MQVKITIEMTLKHPGLNMHNSLTNGQTNTCGHGYKSFFCYT